MDAEIKALNDRISELEHRYEEHFNVPFPNRIIGWWDPVNIVDHPEELKAGVDQMKKDIEKAIATDTPIKEVPEEQWQKIKF